MIFRLGRLLTGGARGPGVFFIIPCVDVFEKIDMRTMTYEIPPQEVDISTIRAFQSSIALQILTKDSVTVFVNAIMYYKVRNPIHAVANVDDYGASARLLAATTLRNVLGTLNLGDILSQREIIAKEMQVGENPRDKVINPPKHLEVGLILVFVFPRTHWWRAQLPGESRLSELR